MDGVSLASGIAGLITLALQISGTIHEYTVAAKNKYKDIEELQGELILLSENLSNLRDVLEDEKLKGRSFDPDGNSVLWKAIKDCRRRIERIGDELLPPTGGKVDRALDRIIWPFKQKEVVKMVDNLRRFSAIFQFAVNIENCKILAKTSEDVENTLKEVLTASRKVSELQLQYGMNAEEATTRAAEVERALEFLPVLLEDTLAEVKEISHGVRTAELRERERRKTEILDWLSPISSLTRHRDVQAKRASGTGSWLLEDEEVVKWSSGKRSCQHILCVGGPGTGKTVLSSTMVDHLRKLHKSVDSVVAYYYCSWDEEQAQTPSHFASTLLRQLCNKLDHIPTSVNEFYQRTKNEVKDQAWFADLQDVLHRVVKTFARCFLVVDALDELPAQQRAGLLEVVEGITDVVGHRSTLRLFATSRPHLTYPKIDFKLIEVVANEHDLRVLISSKLEEKPEADYILDTQLKQQIVDKLTSNARGMFLLPALQIEEILSNDTKSEVRRQLENLSTNLNELYTASISRIRAQPARRQTTARKTLMWLSHARRQLKVPQLLQALATRLEGGVPMLDRDDILHPKIVLDSCCGLVVVERDSNMIKFNHYSVEEYLRSYENHGLFTADECELLLSRTLLTYMRLPELEQAKSKGRQAFERLLIDLPLLDYAAYNWGHHVRHVQGDASIPDLALPFLTSRNHMMAVARAASAKSPDQRQWYARMLAWAHSGGAGVSLAAGFGLDSIIRLLVDECGQNTSARNMWGSNALHETSIHGFESTAQLLINLGMNVLDQNSGGLTPFYLAVAFNHVSLVKSLIAHDSRQLTVSNREGWTPLHKACDIGLAEMTSVLLELGANINAEDDKGLAPLHLAAGKGHLEIVQILTQAGATVHAKNGKRLTPLDFSSTGGHYQISQWLLDHGAVVNDQGDDGWTSLHRAARNGHENVVSLLLKHGAQLMTQDYKGSIPLFAAVRAGSLNIVSMLLNQDPGLRQDQIFHRDKKGEIARIVAFYTAHPEISKYLRGAELEYVVADNAPANQLTRAIEQHDSTFVAQILSQDPGTINQPDSDGQPPLHVAMQEQSLAIAIMLLDAGASIESVGYHGWRPLQIAASLGNLDLVQLCLDHEADVHMMSNTGQTALHKACSGKSVAVVRLLLQRGADPHAANQRGMTPLHIAAHQNQLEIARCLINEHGVDVTVVDRSGDTSSKWAGRSGHYEMLEYLREEERRVKGENKHREKKAKRFEKLERQESASSTSTTLPVREHSSEM